VLDDADLAETVRGLSWASLLDNGQTCYLSSRILAPRTRYDEVVDAVADLARSLRVGDPLDPATRVGPLVTQQQRKRVEGFITAGRAEGARVVLVDITGCTVVDTYTAAHLINTVRSERLLGAQTIITGVSAHVASDLVKLGVRLEDITTRRRLADGLRLALELSKESLGARD